MVVEVACFAGVGSEVKDARRSPRPSPIQLQKTALASRPSQKSKPILPDVRDCASAAMGVSPGRSSGRDQGPPVSARPRAALHEPAAPVSREQDRADDVGDGVESTGSESRKATTPRHRQALSLSTSAMSDWMHTGVPPIKGASGSGSSSSSSTDGAEGLTEDGSSLSRRSSRRSSLQHVRSKVNIFDCSDGSSGSESGVHVPFSSSQGGNGKADYPAPLCLERLRLSSLSSDATSLHSYESLTPRGSVAGDVTPALGNRTLTPRLTPRRLEPLHASSSSGSLVSLGTKSEPPTRSALVASYPPANGSVFSPRTPWASSKDEQDFGASGKDSQADAPPMARPRSEPSLERAGREDKVVTFQEEIQRRLTNGSPNWQRDKKGGKSTSSSSSLSSSSSAAGRSVLSSKVEKSEEQAAQLASLQALVTELQGRLERVSKKASREDKAPVVEGWEEAIAVLEARVGALEREKDEVEDEVLRLNDELAEARSVIGERERELRVLKQVVQEKGEEGVVELKRVLRELKTELEDGRGREEGQRKVIERLKATLEEEAHRRALSHAEDSSARKKGRDGERERRAAVQMSERLQVENLALRLTVENREAELEELQSSVARLKSSMAQRDEQVADLRRALSEVEEGARERERSLLARLLEMKRELARAKRHAGEGSEEPDNSEGGEEGSPVCDKSEVVSGGPVKRAPRRLIQ